MAHATDHQSIQDISKLRKSSQPKIQPQNASEIVNHFLSSHAHWSIDSIVQYLLITYRNDGVDRKIISSCIKDYIDSGV